VKKYVHSDYLVDMLMNVQFWKTLVTILAVTQLGNLVLDIVNWYFYTGRSVVIERETAHSSRRGGFLWFMNKVGEQIV